MPFDKIGEKKEEKIEIGSSSELENKEISKEEDSINVDELEKLDINRVVMEVAKPLVEKIEKLEKNILDSKIYKNELVNQVVDNLLNLIVPLKEFNGTYIDLNKNLINTNNKLVNSINELLKNIKDLANDLNDEFMVMVNTMRTVESLVRMVESLILKLDVRPVINLSPIIEVKIDEKNKVIPIKPKKEPVKSIKKEEDDTIRTPLKPDEMIEELDEFTDKKVQKIVGGDEKLIMFEGEMIGIKIITIKKLMEKTGLTKKDIIKFSKEKGYKITKTRIYTDIKVKNLIEKE